MSISAEEKVCYLREAAIVLAKEGFQLDEVHTDRLCILLDGSPLCEVTESGGVAYRNEDIDEPERIAAKDMVYEIVRNTAEYMRQMEMAPFLKADGLEDGYKVLADFNGTVLAGVQSKHGVHFVTWDWAYGHTGESLQMMERPLMTPDELKSIPKGEFVVMKTGTHPMRTKLRLFLDWGITFDPDGYRMPERAARKIAYIDQGELIRSIHRSCIKNPYNMEGSR